MEINWLEEVKKRKENLLRDLEGFLRIESVKDLETSTTKHPMGKKIDEALAYILSLGRNAGFATKNLDGYVGYMEMGDSDDYIGVLAHVDVVPAPGVWTTPPFEPHYRNGRLYARGAIDDKGPGIAVFYALKMLKELNLPLKRKIRLIYGTDEESGMRCVRHYLETEPEPVMGFSPDAEFPIVHAEKGQINIKLTIKSTGEEGAFVLKQFTAGERGNMVPGRAEAEINTKQPQDLIKHFQGYCNEEHLVGEYRLSADGKVTLILYGKTVHGMEPQKGVNAGLECLHFLNRLPFKGSDNAFISFTTDCLYRDPFGEHLGIKYREDVLGSLTVNAGILNYDCNEGGSVQLNIRCPLNTEYLRTIEIIMEQAEKYGFNIEETRQSTPHYVPSNHPLIKTLRSAYQSITGENPMLLTTGGATYAKLFKNAVAYGAVFPGKEMSAHQIDEFIEIEDLLKATAIYARALYELSHL
ncbi:dipeptidase PepV [Camelliibacillus cellulosilyticus]|uniref:Dipeptidase PepV n=1 Tax=Camelliibacillus cellulosilyticus TaxID=2174486 RepID=A0ABV9GQL8_9BACL